MKDKKIQKEEEKKCATELEIELIDSLSYDLIILDLYS